MALAVGLRLVAGLVGVTSGLASLLFWLTAALALLLAGAATAVGDVWPTWRDMLGILWGVALPVLLAAGLAATAVSGLMVALRGWPQSTWSRRAVTASVAAGLAAVAWLVYAFGPPLPPPQPDQVVGRAIRGPGDDTFFLVTWPHGYSPIGFPNDRVVAVPEEHTDALLKEADADALDERGGLERNFSLSRMALVELEAREAELDGRVFTLDGMQPGEYLICLARHHPERLTITGCQVAQLKVPGRIDLRFSHGSVGVTVRN